MQRLALFDLDNTLVDRQEAFAAWVAEFAAERGLGSDAVAWLTAADDGGRGPRDEFFDRVHHHFGLVESAVELWAAYRARMPELVRCDPAVLVGLEQLREAGWRVGIVSNGMADNQLMKIRRAGLEERVDASCVSGEVGIRKPDVGIFRLAAQRCGTTLAAGGWMVGDNPEHDIAGGRAAGLRTAWIGRDSEWSAHQPQPDETVTDAAAAISLLLDEPWHEPAPQGGMRQCEPVPTGTLDATAADRASGVDSTSQGHDHRPFPRPGVSS
ncbi:HAD family hydrolase [Streptomyces boninensis]|uniref:HAD family hydrolase n=1 Tax=Streptomyces boninensis TaxID=2039455 RepID=UPI003B21392B